MKPFRFLFVVLFAVFLALALSSAVPPPVVHATSPVPDGLTAADWAQIKSQLAPETLAPLNEQAKLTASDAAAGDQFGLSVAVNGNTAVVGADRDDGNGSAYVFVHSGGIWSQQAKLTASDAAADDWFGNAVAISGDTVIVGADGDDDAGNLSGSAYVFIRNGESWSQQAKLTASDSEVDDWFGGAVAISGDTAIVGALREDTGGSNSGSVYVFVRSGGIWSEQAKLIASNAAAGDGFGNSVALSDDTAVIGARYQGEADSYTGSAYVFVRSGTSWSEQAILTASDAALFDFFGVSVAISGDTAIVGAFGYGDDNNGSTDSGAAYIFVRNGESWSEQAKLTASDAAAEDFFGISVAITGDTAVVGAYADDDNGTDACSAYVFVRSGMSWIEHAKLTASDAAAGDYFGYSVTVSGDTAVVGAFRNDDDGFDSGAAYIFAFDNYQLVVGSLGFGGGNIASDPSGIACGLNCEAFFVAGTVITLTATADLGSTFTGWSGDTVTTTNPITVTMDSAKAITATFALNQYDLNVTTVGNGTAAPNSGTYDYGTVVTLTATADTGSTFAGWSGDVVTTTNPITLTIDSDKFITATFTLNQYELNVATVGNGTAVPSSGTYDYGTVVTLTATADLGSTFTGWSGDVLTTTNPITVTMDSAKTITATFALAPSNMIYLPLVVR